MCAIPQQFRNVVALPLCYRAVGKSRHSSPFLEFPLGVPWYRRWPPPFLSAMTIKPHRGVGCSPGTRRKIIGLHKADREFDNIEKKMGINCRKDLKTEIQLTRVSQHLVVKSPSNLIRPIANSYMIMFFEIEILDHSPLPIYHS